MSILIIGWGNPLRGDDALGWKAAEALGEQLPGRNVEIRVSHQLMPEFAEEISRSDLVIFIDAYCDNSSGDVRFERVEPCSSPSSAFSHQMDPAGLLGMARDLYGSAPEAFLFSVGARSFEYGEELSPEVQSALPALLERIQKVCGEVTSRREPTS